MEDWRKDVTPLKPDGRVGDTGAARRRWPRPQPLAQLPINDGLSDHGASEQPVSAYLSNGLSRMTLRKLRHGAYPVEGELDLHGLSSEAARPLLSQFLQQSAQQGLRCINLIHGKGRHSDGREGILKILSRHWLTQHPLVLAFCEAPFHAGGGGAVWVLLKSARETR